MPSQADAFRYVSDPLTSPDQLRQACAILGLDGDGSPNALRTRLIDHLRGLDPGKPVVSLNPSKAGEKHPAT